MKILVIGSEGNIGQFLVAHLRKEGHEVLRSDIIQQWADDYVQTDAISMQDLYTAAHKFKPDAIYHLAAMVSRVTCEKAPHLTINTNLAGTNNVLQLCKDLNARLINFSTSEIYGNITGLLTEDRTDVNPNNRYGLSKLLAEKLVKYEVEQHGLQAVNIRPFMYYHETETRGDHRSAMIRFAEHLLKDEEIEVHKNSERAWLHMEDAVVALEKLLYLNGYHEINIGHPKVVSTEYIAKYMCEKLGKNYSKLVNEIDLPTRMTLVKLPDLRKQKELMGFEPKITVEMGIDRVLEEMKKQIGYQW